MADILKALRLRLDCLANDLVVQREKPSAHDHGLLRTAADEIEQLRNQCNNMEAAIRKYVTSDGWVPYETLIQALPTKDPESSSLPRTSESDAVKPPSDKFAEGIDRLCRHEKAQLEK